MVLLNLKSGDSNIWDNTKPSSPHFCKPLHLQYQKETDEFTEERKLKEQTNNLEDSSYNNFNKKNLKIKIVVDLSMVSK